MLKRAFEPYVTTKPKGTGLGLAVVKKIADEHGARIAAVNLHAGDESDGAATGRGFRYHFRSLRHAGRSCGGADAIPAPAPGDATRCIEGMATILVVDDELGIRALLARSSPTKDTPSSWPRTLRRRGRSRSLRPDLVLLDIWMPDVDGVTLLKEWSATGQLQMPVIMMSGHGTIDTAVEATKYGASAFLEKPITLQKLLRAVEQALVKPTQRLAGALSPQPAYRVDGLIDGDMLLTTGRHRR